MFNFPKHSVNTGLTRLEVDNFRHFGLRAGINIKRLNVFIGPNGRGKSTIVNLYRMFDECIRKKRVGRIGLATLNRYGLVTPKQDDFTLRFFYDNGTFTEVRYRITDNLVWKAAGYRLGRYDNEQLIEAVSFTSEKGLELHNDGLIAYLRQLPEFQMVPLNETPKTPSPSKRSEHAEDEAFRIAVMSELVALVVQSVLSKNVHYNVKARYERPGEFEVISELLFENYYEADLRLADAENDYRPWVRIALLLEKNNVLLNESEHCKDRMDLGEFSEQLGYETDQENTRRLIAHVFYRKLGPQGLNAWLAERFFNDDDLSRSLLVDAAANGIEVVCKQLKAMLLLSPLAQFGLKSPQKSNYVSLADAAEFMNSGRIGESLGERGAVSDLLVGSEANHPLMGAVLNAIQQNGSVAVYLPRLELRLTMTYDTSRLALTGKLERNGKEVPLSSLSKGEDRMLLVKLASQWSSFLEEPETNLHPTNQAQMGRVLAESVIHYTKHFDATTGKTHYSSEEAKEHSKKIYLIADMMEEPSSYVNWSTFTHVSEFEVTFVETHSEPLIRAIQMEIAKNLPRPEWIERANEDLAAHLKARLEQEPNIEITYFDTVDGKVVPRSLGLRRDGVITHRISQDFFYDTEPLMAALFDGLELN